MDAIIAYDLTKKYGSVTALNSLNLEVPTGTLFSIVGSERSGKTTALRIFAGLLLPDGGECSVMACSPYYEQEKAHLLTGVVTDTARMYQNLTISQNLTFFASLYDVETNDAIDRMSFLLHRLDIWEQRDTRVSELPTNALQKTNLARALMHHPKLLLMDEPTEGLDPETMQVVKDMIVHLNEEEGVTALICTRYPHHAELLCDHFAIMDQGELIAKGTLEALRKRSTLKPKALLRLKENSLRPPGFILRNGFWEKVISTEEDMPELISSLVNKGCQLYEIKVIHPMLDDIYRQLVFGEQEEGDALAKENDSDPEHPESFDGEENEANTSSKPEEREFDSEEL